jgi:hypothetical protein
LTKYKRKSFLAKKLVGRFLERQPLKPLCVLAHASMAHGLIFGQVFINAANGIPTAQPIKNANERI